MRLKCSYETSPFTFWADRTFTEKTRQKNVALGEDSEAQV